MKNELEITAHPYSISLLENYLPHTLKCQDNKFLIIINKNDIFFIGKNSQGFSFNNSFMEIDFLKDIIPYIDILKKAKKPERKKVILYEILVDILELLGYSSPLAELQYEISNHHVYWILEAKRYYHSAKILQRNYIKAWNHHNNLKIKSKKSSSHLGESYDTDKVIVYLYSRALECILKSRIFYLYQVTDEYLTEKKQILKKRRLKTWLEKNIYTHNIYKLSSLAGCKSKLKITKTHYDQISYLLEDGKYPAPKKNKIYDYLFSSELEKKVLTRKSTFTGKKLFDFFDDTLFTIIEKCYGEEFKDLFNEWMSPKYISRLTTWGINYKKEVRERNALLKTI